MRDYRIIGLLLLVASCKPAQVSQSSEQAYHEDLSVLRKELPTSNSQSDVSLTEEVQPAVVLSGDITAEIDSINRIIIAQDRERNEASGYVIQVYVGNNRTDAQRVMRSLQEYYSDLDPRMSYRQPNYRVKAGEFFNRLEATRVYNEIKTSFPKAILLPEKLALIKDE